MCHTHPCMYVCACIHMHDKHHALKPKQANTKQTNITHTHHSKTPPKKKNSGSFSASPCSERSFSPARRPTSPHLQALLRSPPRDQSPSRRPPQDLDTHAQSPTLFPPSSASSRQLGDVSPLAVGPLYRRTSHTQHAESTERDHSPIVCRATGGIFDQLTEDDLRDGAEKTHVEQMMQSDSKGPRNEAGSATDGQTGTESHGHGRDMRAERTLSQDKMPSYHTRAEKMLSQSSLRSEHAGHQSGLLKSHKSVPVVCKVQRRAGCPLCDKAVNGVCHR
jgi:hypothetical protein